MIIGNILYDSDLAMHKKRKYFNYVKGRKLNLIEDLSLPTLIVGWDIIKENNLMDVSILEKTIIKQKMYWCFSFRENKQKHVNDLAEFTDLCVDFYFMNKYTHETIDPIFYNINNESELYDIIGYNDKAYLTNDTIYLLKKNNIKILDLSAYSFFGFNVNEILSHIKYYSNTFIEDESLYDYYFKYFDGFANLKRYIVTLIK